MGLLDRIVHGERGNAMVGWTSTAVVLAGALEGILTADLLWSAFALLIAAVLSLPALSTRRWTAMVSWPLPLLVALAVSIRAAGYVPELAGYAAITAVGLAVVVELDRFTGVDLSRRFAVTFAVMTAMAIQGLWTVAQYYSDRWLGTEFLRSQTELQWDFVLVTAAGIAVGVLFWWYTHRFDPAGSFERRAAGESEWG